MADTRKGKETTTLLRVRSAAAAGLAVVGVTTTLGGDALIEAGATLAVANYRDPRIMALIRSKMADSH